MEDKLLHEMSMNITKVSFDPKTQTKKIRMVCSDIGPDCFDERMSLELFNDFTSRIEKNTPVPEPWKSILLEKSGWDGGLPYVSLAHFKSGVEGKNIPADTEKVYVDGEMLKSTAVSRNTPLGNAVYDSLKLDLEGKSKFENKVRVSIGFLDLAHSHGDYVFERKGLADYCPMCENGVGNKVYLKGILVHNALTRVPANPRTEAGVEKSMADSINTREEDAASIVGEALAKDVIKNKSAIDDVDDILVVKADTKVDPTADHPADCTCKACMDKKKMKSEIVEEAKVKDTKKEDDAEAPETGKPDAEDVAEGEDAKGKKKKMAAKTALEVSFSALQDKVLELKSAPREQALQEIQPMFEEFGQVLKNEFVDQKSNQVVASIDPALNDLLTTMKSTLDAVNAKMGSLQDEVTILKSQISTSSKSPVSAYVEPTRRNIQVERVAGAVEDAMSMKLRSIRDIAKSTVY